MRRERESLCKDGNTRRSTLVACAVSQHAREVDVGWKLRVRNSGISSCYVVSWMPRAEAGFDELVLH